MFFWLKLLGGLVVAIVIVYGVYRLFKHTANRRALQAKVTSYFLRAEETEAFYTGFSFVSLLEFFDKNGNALADLPKVYVDQEKKISGICHRFYEVGIGYPNIGKALQADSIPEPEILAVNVADSRVIGGGRAQYDCDVLDSAPAERAAKLKRQMEADKQWEAHAKHAQKILALLKAQFPDSSLQGRARTGKAPAASDVGFGAGYLGNLKLTFATVGTFTASKRLLFVFKVEDGFYVRKDIAEATYGSQLSDLQINAPLWSSGPAKAALTFGEPDLIAINRYIDLLVASSKFVYKNEEAQKTIDGYMKEDLEQLLAGMHGKAIEHSKRLTQLFIRKYGLEENLQVELKFKAKSPAADLR